MKSIAALLVIALPLCAYAQTSEIARKNYSETVKNYCIDQWSAKEKIDLLSKFATLSEHCKCMQDEMDYSVSDDLVTRLIQMQLKINDSTVKYLSDEVVKGTIREWDAKHHVAHRACTERFIRRRQSAR
ncbi:hypothetical protein [Limnohabitans sp.]|jgi:hypothetical protein|uniref:hypothetical protein n=1 Tax=Limnohabitans sp. TaxID=1907725 RepID=UPI0037BFF563